MNKITLLLFLMISGIQAQNYSTVYSVSNSLTTDLTDYQVLLELNTQLLISEGKMQADCDDIRFIPTLGSATQLSYWIESGCNTSTTRVWVKIDFIPSGGTDIYLTYGDDSATEMSNGESTFIFFDDFNSPILDTTKWNINANALIDSTIGDTDMSSTKINLSGTNVNGLQSDLVPDNNFALHSTYYDSGFLGSSTNTWSGVLGIDVYTGVAFGNNSDYSYFSSGIISTSISRSNGWHYSEIYFSNNETKVIVDRGDFESLLVTNNATPGNMVFYSWNTQSNFDTIFIRNYEVDVDVTEGETLSNEELDYIQNKIIVYPNPTDSYFFISDCKGYKISVYNTIGKLILEINEYDEKLIDVSKFNKGIYLVSIQNETTEIIKKLIIN